MADFNPRYLADLLIKVAWEDQGYRHQEYYFVKNFNFYRDVFPGTLMEKACDALHDSNTFKIRVDASRLVPPYSENNVFSLPLGRVDMNDNIIAVPNRFYPRQILKGVSGIFKGNFIPFRVAEINDTHLTADLNHPLSRKALDLEFRILDSRISSRERGGTSTDWLEMALDGPGIQAAAFNGFANAMDTVDFERKDPGRDADFYAVDRLVGHIDQQAHDNLVRIYQDFFKDHDAVLDLMAGWQSHLPDGTKFSKVAGLGMNPHEMDENPCLTQSLVHDLNESSVLPYEDAGFDHAVCSLSVEYLTHPVTVFKEVARVLKPGGRFIVSFSNRWFPEKSISLWENLHEFERVGLVMAFFDSAGCFKDLETRSVRGYPRPLDDTHINKTLMSDPVYVVAGTVI
nr:methyltransferase domain-containing protein [uncultured Desulfobacter sp.]